MVMQADLQNVFKRYGAVPALEDISLQVAPGERLALTGHNGAGKTTLFKLLLGILKPDAGRIRIGGQTPDEARQGGSVGFLPETIAFDPAMTGREVLRFLARLKSAGQSEADEVLVRVGLEEAGARRTVTYSKGMKQRLGLAQAILGAPPLLLLDEPTTGLDPAFRRIFYDIVRERSDPGAAVIISSHALSELEEEMDRIVVLGQGKVLATGTLTEIRRRLDLPVRFRVTTEPCHTSRVLERLPASVSVEARGEDFLLLSCSAAEKITVLRVLSESASVKDLDVDAPSLDAVYAHITKEPAP